MGFTVSLWLVLPFLLSLVYCYTQSIIRAHVISYGRRARIYWGITSLLTTILIPAWIIVGFPLPLFDICIYLLYAVHVFLKPSPRTKDWFILNFNFANMLALHFIIVGVCALVQGTSMYAFLSSPCDRNMSVSFLLVVCIFEDVCFLLSHKLSTMMLANADSKEAQPFMAFLWFCVAYLLIDSMLCTFELEPLYPALFLIGSSIAVVFTLIRFLLHINALVKNHHWKTEHDRLSSMLETAEETVDTLRQLAQKDVLTGVYSRLYAMELIDALIADKTPFALVFIDLDALKQINDSQGHDAGDAYLIGFVGALQKRLRDCDTLARVGGDEFIVLMPHCSIATAEKRFQTIRVLFENENSTGCTFRFSYGVSAFSQSVTDAKSLLGEADSAMYRDKAQRQAQGGRSTCYQTS